MDAINEAQLFLPRWSDVRFRLPHQGKAVAETHPNVTATEFRSLILVLPLMLLRAANAGTLSSGMDAHDRATTMNVLSGLMEILLKSIELTAFHHCRNVIQWLWYSDMNKKLQWLVDHFGWFSL